MGSRLSVTLALVVLGLWVVWNAREGGRELAFEPESPSPIAAEGETLSGIVSRVHDGDTVTLRVDSGEVKVRLGQIDAPELHQPWGREAMLALEQAADGKPARIEVFDVDPYERRVARLYVEGAHVNEVLVRQGHAWAYRRWVRDEEILAAESAARRAGRGLWALPEAQRQPPWDWRRANRRR